MKTLQSLHFIYYKWRNNLRLYNHMILAIIIMFIYLGIVVNVGWQIKIQGPQMTTTPSKMNIFAILAILGIPFTTETCQH